MNRGKRREATMKAHDPAFVGSSYQQAFTIRAPVVLNPRGAQQLAGHATAFFRKAMEANGVKDYKWPPAELEIAHHNDMRGFEILFRTPAKHPGILRVNSAAPLVDPIGRAIKIVSPTASGLLSTTGLTKQ